MEGSDHHSTSIWYKITIIDIVNIDTLPINFTPKYRRFPKDVKDVIRAGGFVLSNSKGNLLIGPVNKQPEETKGWNKEDNQDQDSLTYRKKGQEMNKNLCCEWEKCFLETK